ncbi:MAG: MFS transporter [Spirochaetaceae bacterium]|nr:MAG: MFS transporter [Spirochaetaceae bacterium]
MSEFSHLTRSRAMRRLLVNGGLWGAYGQLVAVTGPIFTGLALWMGLDAADIALIASIAALAGMIQPVSSFITGRLADQKAFVLRFGIADISLNTIVVLVPFVIGVASGRFAFVAAAVLLGTLTGNLVAPVFNSWFSTVLPGDFRARFLGKRMIVVNLAAMVGGYAAGQFIDLTGRAHISFVVPYLVAWLVGVIGYRLLVPIPFPAIPRTEEDLSFNRTLTVPIADKRFRRLLIFYLAWVFAVLIADPFYNVFMIRHLGISYATIGALNAVVLGVGIAGYSFWGMVAGKFGSKPVLQLLIIPRLFLPFIWVLLTPANAGVLLVVIMALNGMVFSGLTVAINTLLFGAVPERGNRAAYFAVWAFTTSLVNATATAVGGLVIRNLSEVTLRFLGQEVSGIRITFVLSGLLMVIPVILVRWVTESEAKPVRHIVGQVLRGNPMGFVYNAFLFSRSQGSRARARAARAMGRSRNPMAVEQLARAMDDLDYDVREQAVRGLGDTRSNDAIAHLAAELADEESDLRAQAAESLGRLRHPAGIDPLLAAIDSADSRVAMSAARALGDIGGLAAQERLYDKLVSGPGRSLLPSLVESLSRLGDLRVVRPAIAATAAYSNPVIRLQLLSAVCRALGARNLFYTLLSKDDYELAERLDSILVAVGRRLVHCRSRDDAIPADLHRHVRDALADGRYPDLPSEALTLADSIGLDDPVAVEAREALRIVVSGDSPPPETDRPEIFAVVCLGVIADTLPP